MYSNLLVNMYAVIKYRFINQKYYMDIINVTENIQTAINLAYGEAKDYYDQVIKCEETQNIVCKFLIGFTQRNQSNSYIFAVMKLPEKESWEDNQYKFSEKETLGDIDVSDLCLSEHEESEDEQLFGDNLSDFSSDDDSDVEVIISEDEEQLFGDNLSDFSSDDSDSDVEVTISEYDSQMEDDYIMEKYFEYQYSEDEKSDEMEEVEFF